MNIRRLLFSFKGSIPRLEYFVGLFIANLIVVAILFISGHIDPSSAPHITNILKLVKTIFYLCGIIVALICMLALAKKRLADLQWSYWWLLLFAIPIVGTGFQLILLFRPAQMGKG